MVLYSHNSGSEWQDFLAFDYGERTISRLMKSTLSQRERERAWAQFVSFWSWNGRSWSSPRKGNKQVMSQVTESSPLKKSQQLEQIMIHEHKDDGIQVPPRTLAWLSEDERTKEVQTAVAHREIRYKSLPHSFCSVLKHERLEIVERTKALRRWCMEMNDFIFSDCCGWTLELYELVMLW